LLVSKLPVCHLKPYTGFRKPYFIHHISLSCKVEIPLTTRKGFPPLNSWLVRNEAGRINQNVISEPKIEPVKGNKTLGEKETFFSVKHAGFKIGDVK
jgi:hypothetical protein